MSISQRLNFLLNALNLNPNSCGVATGIPVPTLRRAVNGKNVPGVDVFERILEVFPQASAEYLFRGIGKPLKDDALEYAVPNDPIEPIHVDMSGNQVIPIINLKAAANSSMGYNSQESFEILDYASLPPMLISPDRQHYWVQLDNDSMEIRFKKDDWVVCQKLNKSEWGSIRDHDLFIVVSRTEGIQFKRIKNRLKEHGFIRCRSDNRKYDPFNIKEADLLELWRYKLHISADGSNLNEDIFNKVDGLEDTVHDLQMMINGMGKQLSEIQKRVIK